MPRSAPLIRIPRICCRTRPCPIDKASAGTNGAGKAAGSAPLAGGRPTRHGAGDGRNSPSFQANGLSSSLRPLRSKEPSQDPRTARRLARGGVTQGAPAGRAALTAQQRGDAPHPWAEPASRLQLRKVSGERSASVSRPLTTKFQRGIKT